MSHTTQGTLLLTRLGIAFDLHPYDYDPDAPRIGLHAAEMLRIDPSRTFKTLMAEVDGKPVCAVIPSDAEASMKKLAAAFGGKAAAMMKVPDAERLTGYKVGGIGPFGQKRKVPTALDEMAELHDRHLHQCRPARPAPQPRAGGCRAGGGHDRCGPHGIVPLPANAWARLAASNRPSVFAAIERVGRSGSPGSVSRLHSSVVPPRGVAQMRREREPNQAARDVSAATPSIRLRFCTAAPDAPLPRLS